MVRVYLSLVRDSGLRSPPEPRGIEEEEEENEQKRRLIERQSEGERAHYLPSYLVLHYKATHLCPWHETPTDREKGNPFHPINRLLCAQNIWRC